MDEELVLADCPNCGEEDHRILGETPQNVTLQCAVCKHVQKLPIERPKLTTIPVVVSGGQESQRTTIEVISSDEIAIDGEFDLHGHRMLITQVQDTTGAFVKAARGADVKALFAKYYDTIRFRVSVNEGDVTKSYEDLVVPEREFHVGQVIWIGGRKLVLKTLKSDQNRTLHKGFLMAKNIKRAFADEAPKRARVGSIIETRRRGAPPGANKYRSKQSGANSPRYRR